jgi:RNA polymerase primary sigma factor
MKNTLQRTYRAGRASLTPPRNRLTPSRLAQQATTEREPVEPLAPDSPRDALQLYLREIGQVQLLTPKEEIVLARRIKRGDKAAREHMIKANLRLVVKIAHDYDGLGLPLLDLINEGNIGLMKGVERFDPKKGAKLSTYASWWIKQSILRALANQSKTIRLPVHVVDKLAHLRRAETKLRDVLERDPTDEELAHEVKLDPRRVRRYRLASRAPVSLDAPIGDDGLSRVSEVVADPNAALPFDRLIQETDTSLVREVLATLTEREKAILALRFGLEDGRPKTLEEVGEHFGVTRERIRQIQEEALKKLRTGMEEREHPSTEEAAAIAVAA